MTVQRSKSSAPESASPVTDQWDDDIDLRQYIDILFSWWREILLVTFLGAVGAGLALAALRQLQTPTYQASSDVVIARVVNVANLDDRFQTFSDEGVTSQTSSTARRSALVGLAKGGAIAQTVVDELGDRLEVDERDPALLLETISALALPSSDSRTQSDLIRITATADDPNKAAAIANAWTRHYVAQINDLFGQVPAEIIESLQAELLQADALYQSTQRTLEDAIRADRTSSLERQIAENQAQLDTLQNSRQAALTTAIDLELAARLDRFANLMDAQTYSAEAVLLEQVEESLTTLSQLHGARTRASRLAEQARALQMQIDAAGDAATATNVLALQLLKAQVFAAAATTTPSASDVTDETRALTQSRQTTFALPAGMQLSIQSDNLSSPDAAAQSADVAALVDALERYIDQIDDTLSTLATDLGAGEGYANLDTLTTLPEATTSTESALAQAIRTSYEQLFDPGALVSGPSSEPIIGDGALTTLVQEFELEIQALQADLEAEVAHTRQLTQQRDLAWNTYDTLSNKVAELSLERTAANSEVRLGSPAIPPADPISVLSLTMVVPLGAALGFLLGIFIAFGAAYQDKQPFLSRRGPSPV